MRFAGLSIVVIDNLLPRRFDYSGFRSPSRSMRRHRSGRLPSSLVPTVEQPDSYRMGDTIFMSPSAFAKLKTKLSPQRFAMPEVRR